MSAAGGLGLPGQPRRAAFWIVRVLVALVILAVAAGAVLVWNTTSGPTAKLKARVIRSAAAVLKSAQAGGAAVPQEFDEKQPVSAATQADKAACAACPTCAARAPAPWWAWPHPPSLPRHMMRRGVQMRGDDRLLRFAQKLLSGAPVSVGLIGGSVSAGHGAASRALSWGGLVAASLQARFNASTVRFLNGAVGACASSYFEACVAWHVDADADLVMLEFSNNDGGPHSGDPYPMPQVRVMERLLRKILAFHAGPAAMVVNFHSWESYHAWGAFYATAGEQFCMAAAYYGQPCAGFKNAVHDAVHDPIARGTPPPADASRAQQGLPLLRLPVAHAAVADAYNTGPGTEPMTQSKTESLDGEPLLSFMADRNHPGPFGHRILADVVLATIDEALAAVTAGHGPPPGWRPPPLPPPMFDGNVAMATAQCLFNDELASVVTRAEGFNYVMEGHPPDNPKPGYVALTAGAVLELTVNTRIPGSDLKAGGDKAEQMTDLCIGILKSYEHMGSARFECVSGCTCKPKEEDGHHESKTSPRYMLHLPVSQDPACVVRITVLPTSKSGEHKYKVVAVILSELHVSAGDFYEGKTVYEKGATVWQP